ncbi:pol, partial [Mucuna pruriens]
MPHQPMLFCEIFYVWGIDFMGAFLVSYENDYILLVVDYVSRWVEAKATKANDAKIVVNFVKSNIFYKFGMPKALIRSQGSHFYNWAMATLLEKYGVVHRVAIAYHPQTNGQAKGNQEVITKDGKPQPERLEPPLGGCSMNARTTYQTPLGMSPYRIIFGKACHLLVEIEHRAYWAIKKCNMELEELRLEAYENFQIYKEKLKHFHDSRILRKEFKVGQKVLLFHSRLKLIVGKLRSKGNEPFVMTNIFPYGAVEVRDEANNCTLSMGTS